MLQACFAALAATLIAGAQGSPEPYWVSQLGLAQVWEHSQGADVVVGVINTGVDSGHPGLAGAVLPGRAIPDFGDGTRDDHGHGTEIALLIAGRGAARGVAPQAKVLPVKVNGGSEELAQAIVWAVDNGADILNISQGNRAGRQSPSLDAALRHAVEQDVIVVAAAGNVPQDREVTSPANRDGVIAVSAVDAGGRFREDVSVEGPQISVAAPGADITVAAGGVNSGTSYSAAIVSGVVALIKSRYPDLDGAAVSRRLTETARDSGEPGRDNRYGFGVINPVAATSGEVSRSWVIPAVIGAAALAAAGGAGWWLRRRFTSRRA